MLGADLRRQSALVYSTVRRNVNKDIVRAHSARQRVTHGVSGFELPKFRGVR